MPTISQGETQTAVFGIAPTYKSSFTLVTAGQVGSNSEAATLGGVKALVDDAAATNPAPVRIQLAPTTIGTDGPDVLTGNSSANLIEGYGGNDTLSGMDGDDIIDGGDGDDIIAGGAGADWMFGGNGIDTLDYSASDQGVLVNLENESASGGHADGDVFLGIENLIGSAFDDILTGDAGNNVFTATAGSDLVYGGGGFDWVDFSNAPGVAYIKLDGSITSGAFGQHAYYVDMSGAIGTAYNDTILGHTGNEIIRGGAGADEMYGLGGIDTLDYTGSSTGINVHLGLGSGIGGDADGDTFTGFENVRGSSYSDQLTGDAAANRLYGGNGSDQINGEGGNDVIAGGEGFDSLYGGAGHDWLDYRDSADGVFVDAMRDAASDGHEAFDLIQGFEGFIGSSFNDQILGRADVGETIRGGLGADYLDGNSGIDTLDYTGSDAAVYVNLANGTASGGHAQGDVFHNFENLTGSAHGDQLSGDDGNNVLRGAAGNDTLSGGAGVDTLFGGAGADSFHFAAGFTRDVISDLSFADGDTLHFAESLLGTQTLEEVIGTAHYMTNRVSLTLDDNTLVII
ncbi:MAG: hypothetical protein Q7J57_15160, partial [Gemmobacter sp.]|nr:hypothetical protein [Gemmobacter sp.]